MYVKSLELINLRSYEQEKIEFSKGINLLIGPNNSGKSTIIKSLYKLQSAHHLFPNDIRKTKFYCKFFIELENISDVERELFKVKDQAKIKAESDRQTVCFYIGSEKVESFFYNSYVKVERIESDNLQFYNEDVKVIDNKDILKNFAGFPQQENNKNFIYPFFSKRKKDYYSRGSSMQAAYSVDDDLGNLPAKVQKLSNSSHPRNKDFNKHCQEILGFNIGVIPSEQSNENIRIGIFIKDDQLVPIESMGEGVANIIGLIAILLTEDRKLYLIEEIENDIHPEALKKLLDLIIAKSHKNQFVVSTHSNIVLKYLAALQETKLFYINWQPNSIINEEEIALPTSSISEIENTPERRLEILKKLGYDLFDFDLFEGYIIFEESSAECFVKDFLIPQFVPKLYGKVKTIAANGADDLPARFEDFRRLFTYIHTSSIYQSKAWVIADGDAAGKTNINKLKEKFASWPARNFINLSKGNIEEYYPEHFQTKVGEVLVIKDKQLKRQEKGKLIINVMDWCFANTNDAKEQVSKSAGELIAILERIQESLFKANK